VPHRPDALLECLSQQVLVLDGGMGTSIHALNLPLSDYAGHENCSEILNRTRPDVVAQIHRAFLEVGCDAIETNTFGANRVVLGEYGLADATYELNLRGAQIARSAADRFRTAAQPRFVLGSIGPGTRLPSLRQISYDELLESYRDQVRGLLDGGVDALLIETCQDLLQAKAAIQAARLASETAGRAAPLMCSVTMETTGAMLVGTDLPAALTALEAFPEIVAIGLNCATGPQEMSEHVRYLSRHCTRYILVQPNAGLPQLVGGRTEFPLAPDEFARWLSVFVEEDGVNIVGGCCGTTPEHLKALIAAIGRRPPRPRKAVHEPSVSSLYHAVTIRQDRSFLIVGERCNANGSRKFKRLLVDNDLDGLVGLALEQVREGCHVLDVCVDCVGRDGVSDMRRVIDRLAHEVDVPLMLDSTEPEVIEAGLKLAGGKCIVNSVNLEDGERKLARIACLLRQYGAAVVALTIDDHPTEAMAKTAARKLEVARRLYGLLVDKYEIAPHDIFFDCLTFPITTGNETDRRLALETLEAVEALSKELPDCHTILGVSNVSFGLEPAARAVLNSAFLAEACARGLTAAIVHAGKILPANQIEPQRWQAALDLIYDRREHGDPLARFISLFPAGEQVIEQRKISDLPVEERLKQRIVDGNRQGLESDLDEALTRYSPLSIINQFLLEGMRIVGELFGSGQMQLPFVLKSAECMKAAVAYLQPRMEKAEHQTRGSILLATVRGDVHDIGKNLVDIILSNNGYKVYNLGIKQPIGQIIEAYRRHQPDAIGLSGLLVKSTLVMRDDLRVLNEHGIHVPVILGGAALNRRYVEQELRPIYRGQVFYAKDAFEGLELMRKITGQSAPAAAVTTAPLPRRDLSAESARRFGLEPIEEAPDFQPVPAGASEAALEPVPTQLEYVHPVPQPPFWGDRVIEKIPFRAALAYINEAMLFQVHWQFRRRGASAEEFRRYLDRQVRPIYRELVSRCEREGILEPAAVYGYWPCQSEGEELIIYAPPPRPDAPADAHGPELLRFRFPRQRKPPFRCLSDFWRPTSSGVTDVIACMLVTVGRRCSEVARQWFEQGDFQQYLFLHGLGVELAEALAEYVHKKVRAELGIAAHDARDLSKLLRQGYQGSRYSFGYPACPNLEDQALLMRLLRPERIGVTLTEEFQLDPEQSTSAIVAYHPAARYFRLR